jgi:hypothetical protein
LEAEGLLAPADGQALLDNLEFLKGIEFVARRDAHQGISVLGATPDDRAPVAFWLGFRDESAFWSEHIRRLRQTRSIILRVLPVQI